MRTLRVLEPMRPEERPSLLMIVCIVVAILVAFALGHYQLMTHLMTGGVSREAVAVSRAR